MWIDVEEQKTDWTKIARPNILQRSFLELQFHTGKN
jgi:hypothetical protein